MILLFEMEAGERTTTIFMAEEHFSSAHSKSDQKLDPPPCSTPPLHYHIPPKQGPPTARYTDPFPPFLGTECQTPIWVSSTWTSSARTKIPAHRRTASIASSSTSKNSCWDSACTFQPWFIPPLPTQGPACLAFIFLLAKLTVNCTRKRNMPNIHVSTHLSITGQHP